LSLPKCGKLVSIPSKGEVHSSAVRIAAQVARKHPDLVQSITGTLDEGVIKLLNKWGNTLDETMSFGVVEWANFGEDRMTFALNSADRPHGYFQSAFQRANLIDPKLGYQLWEIVNDIAYGYAMVLTPGSVFDMCAHYMWFGEVIQTEFIEAYKDMNAENGDEETSENQLIDEIEGLEGPDDYVQSFAEMPNGLLGYKKCKKSGKVKKQRWKLHSALEYFKLAGRAKSDWECELYLWMATAIDFIDSKLPTVWDLRSQYYGGEFEQASPTYVIRWNDSDEIPRWADQCLEDLWNSGEATDAILISEVDQINTTEKSVELLVDVVEACNKHVQLMDQLMKILQAAEGKSR
jgi:PRTRC genetic system protein F